MSLVIESLLAPSKARALANAQPLPVTPVRVVPSRFADSRADEIAMISHELRNSLAVLRNAAMLLRLPVIPKNVDHARALIERHVGQMCRHVEDLLDSAHPDRRIKVLRLSHFDLRTVVAMAVDGIAPDIARRGHRLSVSLPPAALWVHADAARLEQVFSNLLVNAAKYTGKGGDIAVTLERRGDTQACVCVRDSGIGMAREFLPAVFEKFAQADATSPRSEGGAGLGLAVVRNLIEMHGGSVRADSGGLGLGSEFTVLLPCLASV
jgi:two-component system, sensor histidine kinase